MKEGCSLKIGLLLLSLYWKSAAAQDTTHTLCIICGRMETAYIENRIVYVPDYWHRTGSSFRSSFWRRLDDYATLPFMFLQTLFKGNPKLGSQALADSLEQRCQTIERSHFLKGIPLTQAQFKRLYLRRRHLLKNGGELRFTAGIPPCKTHYNLYAWPRIPVYLNGTIVDSLSEDMLITIQKVRRYNPLFGAARIEINAD